MGQCYNMVRDTHDEICVELLDSVYDDAQSRSLPRLRNMLPGADCSTANNALRQINRIKLDFYDEITLKETPRLVTFGG